MTGSDLLYLGALQQAEATCQADQLPLQVSLGFHSSFCPAVLFLKLLCRRLHEHTAGFSMTPTVSASSRTPVTQVLHLLPAPVLLY